MQLKILGIKNIWASIPLIATAALALGMVYLYRVENLPIMPLAVMLTILLGGCWILAIRQLEVKIEKTHIKISLRPIQAEEIPFSKIREVTIKPLIYNNLLGFRAPGYRGDVRHYGWHMREALEIRTDNEVIYLHTDQAEALKTQIEANL